ncbi:MAG: hypothetical protein IBJ15_21085, partial [Alphaproteobacteria bacterium]|nr:hypothetical protein [Alphaproteobacteria bacterium]
MARLRYLLHPFDKPFGGVATILRHVEWLMAAGFDAAIAMAAPPAQVSSASRARFDFAYAPQVGDRVVIPEGLPHLLAPLANAPIRRILFCQNQYYLQFGADPLAGIAEFGVERVLGSSVAVRDFFRDVYKVDIPLVPYAVDPAEYATAPQTPAAFLMPPQHAHLC